MIIPTVRLVRKSDGKHVAFNLSEKEQRLAEGYTEIPEVKEEVKEVKEEVKEGVIEVPLADTTTLGSAPTVIVQELKDEVKEVVEAAKRGRPRKVQG
jgi:hypothetical protein